MIYYWEKGKFGYRKKYKWKIFFLLVHLYV